MKKQYFYVDIDLVSKKIVGHGTTPYATHTGDTEETNIHRVFLTKGQFNKLEKKIK